MKIIWNNSAGENPLNHADGINIEYAVRLQVVKILINEAEHLIDYLSLVEIEINPSNGHVLVHEGTPEPLFSIIANNLKQPKALKVSKVSSHLLAAVNL
nr:hypothetical protein [uncultured Allomuricauda sp.]